ncbi:cysteine protease atg4da isoform X2 [Xiphophorus hellerii]|uniref:cysteine protease atg4da isoform X2 n=1 Tax=Xiphophorus hellerii TaxID=8084 RepID=UPI0013B3B1A6|nr:cysteine protease ATG4D-like isoform X2 [Xiphophorus hellerii]
MNSVSPSAAQYMGVVMQDEQVESRRPPSLERQGSFGFRGPQASDASRDTAREPDEMDKVKAKLMSAWNNVKYGWTIKTKTSFNKISPVTILGHSYLLNNEDEVERFRRDFVSRIWLTYRREFPLLEGSTWTTDCGWGCMLRSGQMLLAQGLVVHLMPRDWTWPDALQLTDVDFEVFRPRSPVRAGGVPIPSFGSLRGSSSPEKTPAGSQAPRCCQRKRPESARDRQAEPIHSKLITWFGDQPPAPFGVHQLVEIGKSSGKKAGDWYGPSIVAHILRKAVAKTPVAQSLAVYVAQDCTIYKEDVVHLCDLSLSQSPADPSDQAWKSVIILVPVRLGGEALNPSYIECVKMSSFSIWTHTSASRLSMSLKQTSHWSRSTAAPLKRCPSAAWIPAAPSASMPRTRRTLSLYVLLLAWLCPHPRRNTPSSPSSRGRGRTMDLRVTAATTVDPQPTSCLQTH